MTTLGSGSGMQLFLEALAAKYTAEANIVFLYHPRVAKEKPWELQAHIDKKQYGVDTGDAYSLFQKFWNESIEAAEPAHADARMTTFNMEEWRWAFGPLRQSVRRAFSSSLRRQLDKFDGKDPHEQVSDLPDEQHAYHCAGVVLQALRKHFKENKRIQSAITSVILTPKAAQDAKLPVAEVLSKYVWLSVCVCVAVRACVCGCVNECVCVCE